LRFYEFDAIPMRGLQGGGQIFRRASLALPMIRPWRFRSMAGHNHAFHLQHDDVSRSGRQAGWRPDRPNCCSALTRVNAPGRPPSPWWLGRVAGQAFEARVRWPIEPAPLRLSRFLVSCTTGRFRFGWPSGGTHETAQLTAGLCSTRLVTYRATDTGPPFLAGPCCVASPSRARPSGFVSGGFDVAAAAAAG